MSHLYRIVIKEQLDSQWSSSFNDLTISTNDDGATMLTGSLPDQAALWHIFSRARDLNLTLLSFNRFEANTESTHYSLSGGQE